MLFNFGQKIEQYDFKVINEREARASAGIMFAIGLISLFTFFQTNSLLWAELFSITFIFEFFVRVIINPKYAPYMLLGSLFVFKQEPEWVEAKPKQFAWILGLLLGVIMTYFIILNIIVPVRFLICVLCLILLFLESTFGICLGCMIYKKFNVTLNKCPGGICEVGETRKFPIVNSILVLVFMGLFVITFILIKEYRYTPKIIKNTTTSMTAKTNTLLKKEDSNCIPPQWAIDMGHKEIWKKHHGCL